MPQVPSRAAVAPRRSAVVVLLAFWAALTLLAVGLTAVTSAQAASAAESTPPPSVASTPPTTPSTSTPFPSPTSTPIPYPTQLPLPPTSLTVAGTTATTVSLQWGESLHAMFYRLERATGPDGAFQPLATVTGRSYTDSTVTSGAQYRYRVQGVNRAGTSPYSAEVAAIIRPSICTTKVTASSTWNGGYVLDISITNTSTFQFYAWQSTVTLPDGHTHAASWPGAPRVSGQTVSQWNQPWNGNLLPGQTARWGLQANRPAGDNAVPLTATCVVAVPAAPAPTSSPRPS